MSNPYPPSGPGDQDPGSAPPPDASGSQYGAPYGDPGQSGQGQPPGSPPPGYYQGAPGGYQQPQRSNPLAITSLVTGIVGVVLCFCWSIPIFGIAAVVTGIIGRNQIKANPQQYKGGGMATAGLILGVIGILIAVVYWILFAAGVFDDMISYNFETSP